MRLPLSELAKLLALPLRGDGSTEITGVAAIRDAQKGDLTFLGNPRYEGYLATTQASAIIMPGSAVLGGCRIPVLESDHPYLDFLRTLTIVAAERFPRPQGIHPTALVADGATLGKDVSLGPYVVVERGASIGDRSAVLAGCFIGANTRLGADCFVYPNVVVREDTVIGERVILHSGVVIGDDGFGFLREGDVIHKIPQIGNVLIEDDCEIGSNTTIDRATTGTTRIGRGTRIDNLVMIAHNVEIGENSILCAQVGISGSTIVGRNTTLGGQAGVAGHIEIGDDVRVGAQGGVTKSIPAGIEVSGYPALPHPQARRIYASMRQLPDMVRLVRDLGHRIEELEKKLDQGRNER